MILHIDMDAFYASVEQLDQPDLRGKPVIVGGLSGRGVVSAASYEARRFGVRSAMPMFQAERKCPDGVFVAPRRDRYLAVSKQILSIFREFSPIVEQVSIDEAYIDISGCETLFGDPATIGASIKQQVRDRVSLTCSVGAAPVRFAAKIASDMEKPDGLVVIRQADMAGFIRSVPIEKVPGVGRATLEIVKQLNIQTLGDVQRISKTVLTRKLGKYGERLFELSAGIDRTPVVPEHTAKSAGSEGTLAQDTSDRVLIQRHILDHSDHVAQDLRKLGVKAGTITLKIKHSDFKTVTRSVSPPVPVFSSESIYKTAGGLFDAYPFQKPVRLVGVSASNFKTGNRPFQGDLFNGDTRKNDQWEAIDHTVDMICKKFGKPSVGRASTLIDGGR